MSKPKDEHDNENDGLLDKIKQTIAAAGSNSEALQTMLRQMIETENFKLREKNRQLRDRVTALEAVQPEAEALVLKKADAARWAQFEKLGKKPEDLETALKEHASLQLKVAASERGERLREVAEAAGYNYKALARLAGELEFEVVETQKDGELQKVVNVLVADGDKKKVKPLSEYAEAEWPEMLPALKAEAPEQRGAPTGKPTKHVRQPGATSQPPQTKADAIKQTREAFASSGDYSF